MKTVANHLWRTAKQQLIGEMESKGTTLTFLLVLHGNYMPFVIRSCKILFNAFVVSLSGILAIAVPEKAIKVSLFKFCTCNNIQLINHQRRRLWEERTSIWAQSITNVQRGFTLLRTNFIASWYVVYLQCCERIDSVLFHAIASQFFLIFTLTTYHSTTYALPVQPRLICTIAWTINYLILHTTDATLRS